MDLLLNKIKKDVKLAPQEKAQMREQLIAFMAKTPIRQSQAATYQQSATLLGYQLLAFRKYAIVLLLVLCLGTGSSYAAEGTIPGDILYPIKVRVNESVKKVLARSPEARAQVAIELASRRLLETEKLAEKGVLTAAVRAELEGEFLAHTSDVQKQIVTIQSVENTSADNTSDADARVAVAISADLESTLAVHERILVAITEKEAKKQARKEQDTKDHGLNFVLGAVREQTKTVAILKAETASRADARPRAITKKAAEKQLMAAEAQLKDTVVLTQQMNPRVQLKTREETDARNRVASQIIAEGKTKLEAGATREALPLFERARQISRETKFFVEANAVIGQGDDTEEDDTTAILSAPAAVSSEQSAATTGGATTTTQPVESATTTATSSPSALVNPTAADVSAEAKEKTNIELGL